MLCAVHLLDGATENVALDKHATGSCLLEEVCRRTKLTPEMDYFSLRFLNKSGQEQWLNLRNQIRAQICKSQIYHLHLRVKYFVKQSQIFLGETKHQFFLDVRQNLSEGKYIISRDKYSRLAALSLRRDHGEDSLKEISKYPLLIRDWNPQSDIEALGRLRVEHAQLKGICGVKAEERLLSELEEEQTYGADLFSAVNYLKERVIIAVCVDALRVYDNDHGLIDEYRYSTGLYPSVKGTTFVIEIEENYRCYKITYKLDSKTAARSLYRTTVEFCTFFTQDKVYDWVLETKTTKKTFGAVFKRKSARRKNKKIYDFDILRTAPEVFNRAWRVLAEEKAKSIQIACGLQTPKILEQKAFKFGPDTPKSSTTNLVFDFSRPASILQSRSGCLTPTLPTQEVADSGLSRSSGLRLETPGASLRHGASLTRGISQRDLSSATHAARAFPRQTINPIEEGSLKANSLLPAASHFVETREYCRSPAPPASPNRDQTIHEIVAQLKATSSAQKEKKTFQARFLCKFCRKAYRNCSFVPCGHVVACANCALSCDKCSECKTRVETTTSVRYP